MEGFKSFPNNFKIVFKFSTITTCILSRVYSKSFLACFSCSYYSSMIWKHSFFCKSNQLLIFSILVIFGLNAFEGEYEKNNSQLKIFVTTLMLEAASQPVLFCKNSVFKNFAKFTGKRLC